MLPTMLSPVKTAQLYVNLLCPVSDCKLVFLTLTHSILPLLDVVITALNMAQHYQQTNSVHY